MDKGLASSRSQVAESQILPASALPKDVWGVVIQNLHIYDTIFVRASSSWFYKLCKEYRPFPKYFVLDQDKCLEYLVKNGSISCLDYVKNTLRFEWTNRLCSLAAAAGQVDTLQHLLNNGLDYRRSTILLECILGTCDINMIKFLHERGVSWEQDFFSAIRFDTVSVNNLPDNEYTTTMESMAYHGHLECMKYAIENECTMYRHIWYTPSTECLDFAIENGFSWQPESNYVDDLGMLRPAEKNICGEAARVGNLKMLKYAHQKGAAISNSAFLAAISGHLDCLQYAFDNSAHEVVARLSIARIKTKECFEFLANKLGMHNMVQQSAWVSQLLAADLGTLRLMLKNNFPLPTSETLMWHWHAAAKSIVAFKFWHDEAKAALTNIDIYARSARGNNLDVFKFALERNLPRSLADSYAAVMGFAILTKNVELVALVHEVISNEEGFTTAQISDAAQHSTPEILDFLARHGVQWTSSHLSKAAESSNLPNLAYLTRAGCKLPTKRGRILTIRLKVNGEALSVQQLTLYA